MSYSCKNSQSSPFLQRCLNQCLQTIVLSPRTCLKGQLAPLAQVPSIKNSHKTALFSGGFVTAVNTSRLINVQTYCPCQGTAWAVHQVALPEKLRSQIHNHPRYQPGLAEPLQVRCNHLTLVSALNRKITWYTHGVPRESHCDTVVHHAKGYTYYSALKICSANVS